jgi:L-rhamnose mutarotase
MVRALGEEDAVSSRLLCFALDLKDDAELIARYRAWHAPGGPPATVIRSIRDAGIEEMQIFLAGNRLFMMMEIGAHFSLAAKAASDAADPAVQAWERQMEEFQQFLPFAKPGEKWVAMERIFALSEQP